LVVELESRMSSSYSRRREGYVSIPAAILGGKSTGSEEPAESEFTMEEDEEPADVVFLT